MVQKHQVVLIDDLDGSTAHETVYFSLDGKSLQIDLSNENAARLRAALQPWVQKARRYVGGRAARGSVTVNRNPRTQIVRAWAKANGHEVSDRGRIPQPLMDLYEAAQR